MRKLGGLSDLFHRMKVRIGAFVVAALVRLVFLSLRLKVWGEEHVLAAQKAGGGILAVWHGVSLLPVYHLRARGLAALVSLSRDGDYQAEFFRRMGWTTVRGSSRRASLRAVIGGVRTLRGGNLLGYTPDGPTGPARVCKRGCIYLARVTGRPIIPIGVYADRAWRLPTWDRHMLPQPFARASIVYSEPIYVATELRGQEDGYAAYQSRVEQALTEAEGLARRLALGG